MRLLILTMLLSSFGLVQADEDTHKAIAARVFEASGGAEVIQASLTAAELQFRNMATLMEANEAERPAIERYAERGYTALREELDWDKLLPIIVDAYAKTYTEEELLALLEFYESPIGKTYVEKNPELRAVVGTKTEEMMTAYLARLEELQQVLMSELEAGNVTPQSDVSSNKVSDQLSPKEN